MKKEHLKFAAKEAIHHKLAFGDTLFRMLVAAGELPPDAKLTDEELLTKVHVHTAEQMLPETADWFRSLGAEEQECCRPKNGKRVEDLGGFNSWEWEYAPALKLKLGEGRDYKWAGGVHKVLPGFLYRWADRPTYWLVLPDEHPLQNSHEVLLPRQPKTRGDVQRLVAVLTPLRGQED